MIVINNTFYEFLYGDNSTIQPSYSLGVAFEVSEDIAASVEQDGIQFFLSIPTIFGIFGTVI
ncbi:hypothetical protein COM13_28535 [Bacillus pseudomycoides]|nr:hypothetical protein bmyco0003_52560 [Bacillus pseudomycoides]PDX98713.1 hypothetical protein COO07_20490 [Bacillus pseudomycoides]PEE04011.1 hypothetical protein CON86_22220 [Bacillus pseudomycoides]PEK29923.1 hypothetical protein CN691_21170 [Bacillus pseudomycoides]PEK65969.1 hypothetical protein CN593_19735 [Bacillus pseudomycoides]